MEQLVQYLFYVHDYKWKNKIKLNQKINMDGLNFLKALNKNIVPVCFFDPQYRGVLDKLKYGNEGKNRGALRSSLEQMNSKIIKQFIKEIDRVLWGSGHLFLWIDKFHLCTGFDDWIKNTTLEKVDMITWDKARMGMGYRTRRQSEHLIILQKKPKRAKDIWTVHDIPDVWREKIIDLKHTHQKPANLQERLIEAVSKKGDVILDPAAGSFSVMEACKQVERNFLGCDIEV